MEGDVSLLYVPTRGVLALLSSEVKRRDHVFHDKEEVRGFSAFQDGYRTDQRTSLQNSMSQSLCSSAVDLRAWDRTCVLERGGIAVKFSISTVPCHAFLLNSTMYGNYFSYAKNQYNEKPADTVYQKCFSGIC